MKFGANRLSDGHLTLMILVCLCCSAQGLGAAANPYETITTRNVFGIKPPAPPAPVEQPKPQAPEIKLQGLTTILGNKLVLFKATIPAKPPEQPAPKQMSFMLSEGQRDGEIEVLEINAVAGIVKFRNYGVEQTLNMKDNVDKPVVLAAPPPLPGVPGVTAPTANPAGTIPAPVVPGSVTTIGGGQRTIPTRNVRSSSEGDGASALANGSSAAGQVGSQRSIEANVALYEINRAKNEKLIQSGVKLPRMPEHPLLQRARAEATPQSQ
ncbi:MAG: hypothetical protein HOP33_21400 [Verrucomicrobia bacterium]|nr:hypothetical protein [Verrucomicrobiota bacterium]